MKKYLIIALILAENTPLHAFVLVKRTRAWNSAGSCSQTSSKVLEKSRTNAEDTSQTLESKEKLNPPTAIVVAPHKPASRFNLTTALFCGGLAFDSYIEPPANSSRWERGSQGCNVAFLSPAFTRSLYKGLVRITPLRITDLPAQASSVAERLVTGSGVDASLWVAAVEGRWKEDVELLTTQNHHEGVWSLTGAAHVGRSSTAWSNVDEAASKAAKLERGRSNPYYIPATDTDGAQAVWPEPECFYLYVQDPGNAILVFTVIDTDVLGKGMVVGSTCKLLSDLIPEAELSSAEIIEEMKFQIVQKVRSGEWKVEDLNEKSKIRLSVGTWQGLIPIEVKPQNSDKLGTLAAGAAAGALIGGPVGAAAGAAAGAALANLFEPRTRGQVEASVQYLPIPPIPSQRKRHVYKGGMPGIDWGILYERFRSREKELFDEDDLELCFFVTHDKTGGSCAVYRSLRQKLVIVSFRGTCRPIDLMTDVTIHHESWVQGEEETLERNKDLSEIPKVHAGFRKSLNSISRRLKELLLAAVAPGDDWSDYNLLVTGHSLGGALATLFAADVAEYGFDAGRSLPQVEPSEPWWKGVISRLPGHENHDDTGVDRSHRQPQESPPRPKSIRLYTFGSPRVGNRSFAKVFDRLVADGRISEAYRIVNGDDIVTRLPRTMNVLLFGSVDYEHVGSTVLLSKDNSKGRAPKLWIEGESDDRPCPVRDGEPTMTNSLINKSFLKYFAGDSSDGKDEVGDNGNGVENVFDNNVNTMKVWSSISNVAGRLSKRLPSFTASDVANLLGLDRDFTEREIKILNSLIRGYGIAHHMEDEYYTCMGGACGFATKVGEEIAELVEDVEEEANEALHV